MNILIVKLSAIGDIVHALPVAQDLKSCFPGCRITWVAEAAGASLLKNHPYIDEVLLFDKPLFKSLGGLVKHAPGFISELRKRRFDLVLDLQGLMKSALIARLSGAPKRLVYENAREGSHLLAEKVIGPNHGGHVVELYRDVVRHLGCQLGPADFGLGEAVTGEADKATAILRHVGVGENVPYAVLALGANWPNKIWPQRYFAALSDKLSGQGIVPVAIGAAGDRKLYEEMAALTEVPPVDLTGKTNLQQLAAVIKGAVVFIGGDTGPMHMAAALGVKTICLMGPTDANRNGPYGQPRHALEVQRDCAGCWKRSCPKGLNCLDVLTPEQVWEKVQEGAKQE